MSSPILCPDLLTVEASILRQRCRDSFEFFVREFWGEVPGSGNLIWNWHLSLFCDELQKVAERVFAWLPREYDLVCNVSPGTSKSTVWSILFPAWVWTRMPSARFLTGSHTDDLVIDLSNKSRTVIKSEKYRELFPEIVIRDDTDSKGHFGNTLGGDRKTCTVAGKSPTGFHAHFIISDDPIDPKKVLSEAELDTAKGFVTNIIPTRKTDKLVAVTCLVMQRLGLRDPTDVMLDEAKKEGAIPVRHICLPAELDVGADGSYLDTNVEPKELATRYVDGLMDPYRLSHDALKQYKAKPHYYSCQFLQKPFDLIGGMFQAHWFNQRVKAAPFHATRIRYVDRASTADGGCYTAMVLMAKHEGNYYVENVVHGQWEPDERNKRMRAVALQDRARYGPRNDPQIWVEAEGGSSGRDAWKSVARAMDGFPIHEDRVTGSKDTRSEPWACQLAAGNVYLVDDGSWDVDGYVQEHVAFKPDVTVKRLGKYKDQVDASSGAYNLLVGSQAKIGSFRILGPRKQQGLRIMACSTDELENMVIDDQRVLLIHLTDPKGVMCNVRASERGLDVNGAVNGNGNGEPSRPTPKHAIAKLLESKTVAFAPLDPADCQESWGQSVEPWGKPVAEVMMQDSHGKQVWSFLLKKRDPSADLWVIVDEGDGRALSAAMAVCDSCNMDRKKTLYTPSDPEYDFAGQKAKHRHVYEMTRACRHKIVF